MQPPIVVIGMHRSGTSLIAWMLTALGVYLGPGCGMWDRWSEFATGDPEMEGTAEAADFYALNEGLLLRAGATWNRVEPFLARRDRPLFAAANVARLRAATFGRLRKGYLAPLPANYAGPWGWKDPRTSVTLPYWLRLFPTARVIHVRRDPEAVIESLWRRAQFWASQWEAHRRALPLPRRVGAWLANPGQTLRRAADRALRLLGGTPPPVDPCLDRDYCRLLSETYLAECLRYRRLGERYLEIHYEEVLADPAGAADRLAGFAGVKPLEFHYELAARLVRFRWRVPGALQSVAPPSVTLPDCTPL